MSNMSYCRFRNTIKDLQDCYDNVDDRRGHDEEKAFRQLVKLCCDIALDYGYIIDRTIEEE